MLAEFGDLLGQTVQIEPYAGMDSFTVPIYLSAVEVLARVEQRNRRLLGSDNVVIISSITVYMSPTPEVSTQDRITLPDGSQPAIIMVEKQPDENGDIYYQAVMTV